MRNPFKIPARWFPPNAPFRVLSRVFLLRIVDLELLSSDADTTKLLSQFGAMFASASFLCTAPIILLSMQFHLPDLPPDMLRTMEHLFFATTMLLVGLVAVLSWESIFPDKQDLLILAPLPVRVPTLFFSKISALAAAVGLVVLSLNCFTGVFWPLLFAAPNGGSLGVPRSLCAYWITVTAAALFTFCAVLTVHGAASILLTRQAFLRLSAWIQLAAFCLLIGGYILEPSLESTATLLAPQNQTLLACLPAYWFLGLFQQLNGTTQPVFQPLAREAWLALAIATVGATVAVLVAYFATVRRIVEQPDILPSARRTRKPLRLGSQLTTAIFAFTARGLMRSRQHRVLFALYAAIGFTTVVLCVASPWAQLSSHPRGFTDASTIAPFLEASYLMMIFAVTGARVIFVLPVSLRANWLFRVTEIRSTREYRAAVHKSMLLLTVMPVALAFAVATIFLCAHHWSPLLAAVHLLVLVFFGSILVELALGRFHKLPFTASYLPGKSNIHLLVWIALIALIPLGQLAAADELRILSSFVHTGAMLTGLIALLAGMHSMRVASQKKLEFEANEEEYIISLRLAA